jgi:hypothetical protein
MSVAQLKERKTRQRTTFSKTDVAMMNGRNPVETGRTPSHAAIGVIHRLGAGVTGYGIGPRVLVGAPGGLGNNIDETKAEYVVTPQPPENLALVPNGFSEVLFLEHVASTGCVVAEQTKVQSGGVAGIRFITHRRGVDVAFVDRPDVRGVQPDSEEESFAGALRLLPPGETLSSVGVSRGHRKAHPPNRELTSDAAREATCGTGPNEQTRRPHYAPAGRNGCAG